MEYKVVNKNTGRRALNDNFDSKIAAEQAIINVIRGATSKAVALSYYREMTVKPV